MIGKIIRMIRQVFSGETFRRRILDLTLGAIIGAMIAHYYYVKSGRDLSEFGSRMDNVITKKTTELGNQMDQVIMQKTKELGVSMDQVIMQKTKELGAQVDRINAQAKDIYKVQELTFDGLMNNGIIEGRLDNSGHPAGINATARTTGIQAVGQLGSVQIQVEPSPETAK